MSLTFDPVIPPLGLDAHGVCRVSGSRVTLESLLGLFHQGATAEDIHQAFSSVPLADVYAVIAYYLQHRDEVDGYLQQVEEREQEARREMKSRFPMTEMRERLLARRKPVSV